MGLSPVIGVVLRTSAGSCRLSWGRDKSPTLFILDDFLLGKISILIMKCRMGAVLRSKSDPYFDMGDTASLVLFLLFFAFRKVEYALRRIIELSRGELRLTVAPEMLTWWL